MIAARARAKRKAGAAPFELWVHKEVMYRDAQGGEAVLYTACLLHPASKEVFGGYVTPAFALRTDAIAHLLARKAHWTCARRKYVLRGDL